MSDLTLTREQAARIAREADEFEAEIVTLHPPDALGGVEFTLANDDGRCRAKFGVAPDGELS